MDNNSTISCCTYEAIRTCSASCPEDMMNKFSKMISGLLWPVDVMLVVNAILGGVIVGIGAYGHRYRHYGFTRLLLLGATTLFAPVISYILSAAGSTGVGFVVQADDYIVVDSYRFTVHSTLTAKCNVEPIHPYLVMVSTTLVLISAINTSPTVATDDREDRTIRPPFELLLKGIWILYLIFLVGNFDLDGPLDYLKLTPFALILAKMVLKTYAFLKAQKSFAIGYNPRLTIGYMQQLRDEGSDQHGESATVGEADVNMAPPPLVVMGEDDRQVERQPHGYMFRSNLEALQEGGLVTLDRVWQLDNMFPMPMQQSLKDICLSFALFKLLRCRFARCKLTVDVISTETLGFVRSVLLKEGEQGRAFRIIADELSFAHDYYDSPLPISYSDSWLTIFSMLISVLSIGYCILSGRYIIYSAGFNDPPDYDFTVYCYYFCTTGLVNSESESKRFGSRYFDLVPVVLLLVFVMVAEARDIASHICSSWTKVILTCRCVHRASLQLSPVVPKWARYLLQCRCNRLMRHWNDRMGQNSMLVPHPRQLNQLVFPGWLLRLLGLKSNSVKVPSAVKVRIINAIRSISSGADLSKGIRSLRQSQIGEILLWACNSGKGTTDTILVWHIATTILEVKHPSHQQDDPPRHTRQGGGQPSSISDDKKTAATHLSRYCAYLVAFYPELLPDDDAWSKGLYKDVKKDAKLALATAGGTGVSSMPPEAAYGRLIDLLGARVQNHQVLKDAAKLAGQLGELTNGGEETAWELLAGFWSEMVLYVAPSDNLNGHMQAIDQGGELITLLWALLTHVGIVERPESAAAASAPSSY